MTSSQPDQSASRHYHVAERIARESIRKHGLRPGAPGGDGQPPGVYLWPTEQDAHLMRHEFLGYDPEQLEVWAVMTTGLPLMPDPWIARSRYCPVPIEPDRIRLASDDKEKS